MAYKANDKITDASGQVWRRTQGGNWRGEGGKSSGKLYSGKGDPTSTPTATPSAPQAPSDPSLQPYISAIDKLSGGDKQLREGFLGGLDLANTMYAPGSLGRVSETADQNQIDIQNRLKTTADGASELSPLVKEALDLRRASLTGMSPEALLAARDAGQAGINRSLNSGLRTLNNEVGGPRGAALNIKALPILQTAAFNQSNLENNLTQQNESLKQQNLNSFTNEANRASEFTINDSRNKYNDFVNFSTGLRADLYGRQLQNLNAIAAEKTGFQSSIFGGGAFKAEQIANNQSFDLAKENLEFQKKQWKSGNSGSSKKSSSSSNSSTMGTSDSDTFG